jgi:(R,R)-butanediol dehydrogenase/meso-butanediol dehydrogenase/diacetyl reductase
MKRMEYTAANKIELRDAEKPVSDGKSVIVKVEMCGICGSDLHNFSDGNHIGVVPGHEFSGVIEDPGDSKWKKGQRVTYFPQNPCGECESCKKGLINLCANNQISNFGLTPDYPGAFAEYVACRPDLIYPIPDGMTFKEGALCEPAAVALHGVSRAGVTAGDKVLVTGGGPIGLMAAAMAKVCGATYVAVVETNDKRIARARTLNDAEVFDGKDPKIIEKLLAASGGGFDRAIECAGPGPAIDTCIFTCKPRGVISLTGVSIKPESIYVVYALIRELSLVGSMCYLDDFPRTIDIISRGMYGDVNRFATRVIGMDEVQEAFIDLEQARTDDLKILVDCTK